MRIDYEYEYRMRWAIFLRSVGLRTWVKGARQFMVGTPPRLIPVPANDENFS